MHTHTPMRNPHELPAPPVLDLHVQATLRSGDRRFALNVAFQSQSERTALLGASGSGKSTLLQAVAGLLPGVRGHVRVNGLTLLDSARGIDLPARRRQIGYLFQDYALFPHMTVLENVRFGARQANAAAQISDLLERLDIDALRHAMPRDISGGQRQRVALARALASSPKLLLLDEPLSALDTPLRLQLRAELADMLTRVPIPTLLVTHDPQDVAALAQSVVALHEGATRVT